MKVTIEEIENYLKDIKEAVRTGRYRVELNKKRQDNRDLYLDYNIKDKDEKQIILSLTAMDFSEILINDHFGFEHERLYVFGKDVKLLPRFGTEEETVSLYIKFNKLEDKFVIVISFHKQKYKIKYYFR